MENNRKKDDLSITLTDVEGNDLKLPRKQWIKWDAAWGVTMLFSWIRIFLFLSIIDRSLITILIFLFGYLQAQLKNAKLVKPPEPSASTESPSTDADGAKAGHGEFPRFPEFSLVCLSI